jgi:hypothetical protein
MSIWNYFFPSNPQKSETHEAKVVVDIVKEQNSDVSEEIIELNVAGSGVEQTDVTISDTNGQETITIESLEIDPTTKRSLDSLTDRVAAIESKIDSAVATIVDTVKSGVDSIESTVATNADVVVDKITKMEEADVQAARDVISEAEDKISSIVSATQADIEDLGDNVTAATVTEVVNVEQVVTQEADGMAAFGVKVVEATETIKVETVETILATDADVVQPAEAATESTASTVVNYVEDSAVSLKDAVVDAAETVEAKVEDAAHAVGATASNAAHTVETKVEDAAHTVGATASNAAHAVEAKVEDAAHAVGSAANAVGSTVVNAATVVEEKVVDVAKAVGSSVASAATAVEEKIVNEYYKHFVDSHPSSKVTIVGGGIVGAIEAYFAHLTAKDRGEQVRVTVFEKRSDISETTTANIFPSLTVDEILAVVPRGRLLLDKLGILFSEPGGIRVDDVADVNDTPVAQEFIDAVLAYSENQEDYARLTQALLKLGRHSMNLWQKIYDHGDDELKQIMRDSNFNPCREPELAETQLHDGYRIDLIYKVPNAHLKAEGMQNEYASLGYKHCKVLSPLDVVNMDPSLEEFCAAHTHFNEFGEAVWNNDTTALFRPGGCIDTAVFLPKFYAYLQKVMGTYTNLDGKTKNCFKVKYDSKVDDALYLIGDDSNKVAALLYNQDQIKANKYQYADSQYVFVPGEAVGTLRSFGFAEPSYAGFAGASLRLSIPLNAVQVEKFADFNHTMEVHQEGVVLAWQARRIGDTISIGVAGTKAFYADQTPEIDQDFAKNRNLLQLNMINDVLPQFMSIALGRDTRGQTLTEQDLAALVDSGIAKRWVGTRAVAYDGGPTVGALYNRQGLVPNARTTTQLGSGGGAFAPAAVDASRAATGLPSAKMLFSRAASVLGKVGFDLDEEILSEAAELGQSNRSAFKAK